MGVQINDCTIRDGGYLLAKNSPEVFVKSVVTGLLEAGVDAMEIGFLQDSVTGETLVYGDSEGARRFIPVGADPYRFTGFCDNSRYSIDSLDGFTGKSFGYLKISFAKHESEEALGFVERAKNKGYEVFANPMDAPSYTKEERSRMIDEVNRIRPYCFSIVDTFGTMYLNDLVDIFRQVDARLDPGIRIGLHSHNNLQLSNALAETMIDLAADSGRDIVVDCSLYGMGRGAGNACTEVVAGYLNERYGASYDLGALFDVIEGQVSPLQEDHPWGYDPQMLVCGLLGAHVDNISHLKSLGMRDSRRVLGVLSALRPEERKRYGSGYSKSDFTALDAALELISVEGGAR